MMRKSIFLLCFILLLGAFCFAAGAEDVVYLDGTGETPGAYQTLAEAVSAVNAGGKVVVCGVTEVTGGANLAKGFTLTSVDGDADYRERGAYLSLSYRTSATSTQAAQVLGMGGDTVFENITLKNNAAVPQMIAARGYQLTVGKGVVCTAASTAYPSLIGCYLYAAATGKTVDLTVESGTWDSIYGGNWQGTFTGDSTVNLLGGTVLSNLAGGGYRGGFNGSATLNIGGDAVVRYNASAAGIVGGLIGASGGTAYPFNGDIHINIGDNADISCNILGTSRYTNITTTADVTITISGNAQLHRHVYGAGYGNYTAKENGVLLDLSGNAKFTNPQGASGFICAGANSGSVTGDLKVRISENVQIAGNVYGAGYSGSAHGNSTVLMSGGSVGTCLSAGLRTGTLVGDATVEMTGGRLTNASYGLLLGGGVPSATAYGTVSGRSAACLDGGEIAGSIYAEEHTGSYEITLKSGTLGSISPTVKTIDLSGGKTLSVGGSVNADTLTGGGRLRLSGALTASAASGKVTLEIAGTPQNKFTYVTVNDPESTLAVEYLPKDDEVLVRAVTESALTYTANYADRYDTTHIRVNYYNPHGTEEPQPKIVMATSTPADPNRVAVTLTKGVEDGIPYAEADLAPGHYYYKVYYGSGGTDYEIRYFIVSGKEVSHTYEAPLEPYAADSYMEPYTAKTTDEMMAAFFNNGDLDGFEISPTPTFTMHTEHDRAFMSNAELLAYIDTLSAPYLYKFAFDLDTSYNNKMPLLVFTKDEIAPGATLEEVAATVRAGGVREIWQIDGGIHGNEPTGIEAALWFAAELCDEYGEDLLDRFGAIVILPDACPDNSQRFMRNYEDGVNSNRDLIALSHAAAQKQAYVFDLFMPTVFVDMHEDYGNETIDTADYSVGAIVDIRFGISGSPNSGLSDVAGILDGTAPVTAQRDYQTIHALMREVAKCGLRTCGYYAPQYNPGTSVTYAKTRGAYAFLFESMRIWTGKQRFARSVFAEKTALRALASIICNADGAFAAEVDRGRAKAAVTVYDETNYFATKMSRDGAATFTVSSPSAYLNGKIKDPEHTETFREFDTVLSYRPMPTGYVLPADTENIADILALCDLHGIEYLRLKSGASLTLRRYTTMSNAAALGAAAEVNFDDGAYLFLTDNEDAYLVAYLFEPDSMAAATDTKISLLQMGLLSTEDALYRSEIDNLRAAVAPMLPSPDTDDLSPLTGGEIYTALAARANGAAFGAYTASSTLWEDYTAAVTKPLYPVNYVYEIRGDYILPVEFDADGDTLSFTAEADKIYALTEAPLLTYGDANSDGHTTLADALRILRTLADETVDLDRAAADIDHTASIGLLDVLTTLRTILG